MPVGAGGLAGGCLRTTPHSAFGHSLPASGAKALAMGGRVKEPWRTWETAQPRDHATPQSANRTTARPENVDNTRHENPLGGDA